MSAQKTKGGVAHEAHLGGGGDRPEVAGRVRGVQHHGQRARGRGTRVCREERVRIIG